MDLELLNNEFDEAVRVAAVIDGRVGTSNLADRWVAGLRRREGEVVVVSVDRDAVLDVMTVARFEVLSDPDHPAALWTLAAELDVELGGDGDLSHYRGD